MNINNLEDKINDSFFKYRTRALFDIQRKNYFV